MGDEGFVIVPPPPEVPGGAAAKPSDSYDEADGFVHVSIAGHEEYLRTMMEKLKVSEDAPKCHESLESLEAMLSDLKILKERPTSSSDRDVAGAEDGDRRKICESSGLFRPRKVAKQERTRTTFHVRNIALSNRIPWTFNEELLLYRAHEQYGPNWSLIASILKSDLEEGGRLRTPEACCYHHCMLLVRGWKDKKTESRAREQKVKGLRKRRREVNFAVIVQSMKTIDHQNMAAATNLNAQDPELVPPHPSHLKALAGGLRMPRAKVSKLLMPHELVTFSNMNDSDWKDCALFGRYVTGDT
uniref:Myb-like domain-containing protein n=1 Tax=Lotharella globosa TaxID=91324 RepID=A0A6V3SXW6_9EUKA